MKIYEVKFRGIWPVGSCCIIAAYNKAQAENIARETITHTDEMEVVEVIIEKPMVIEYLSGDY